MIRGVLLESREDLTRVHEKKRTLYRFERRFEVQLLQAFQVP